MMTSAELHVQCQSLVRRTSHVTREVVAKLHPDVCVSPRPEGDSAEPAGGCLWDAVHVLVRLVLQCRL